MGDGGKTLNVPAKNAADGLGLGLAKLWEFVGHVGDRAVLLAQLLPHGLFADCGGVALGGEDLREHFGRTGLGSVGLHRIEPFFYKSHAALGEFPDGRISAGFGEEAKGLDGQVVVLLSEAFTTMLGQREHLGRSSTTPRDGRAGLSSLHLTLVDEVIEVATYGGGSEIEPLGKGHGGRGTLNEDRLHDALTRRLVVALGGLLD